MLGVLLVSTTLLLGLVAGSLEGELCAADGDCPTAAAGLCQLTTVMPGTDRYCCDSATACNTPCYSCNHTAGACVSDCATAGGCPGLDPTCADVPCINKISAFTGGTTCTWYTSNVPKFCKNGGTCATFPTDCGTATTSSTTCVSPGCTNSGLCVVGQASTPVETQSSFCYSDNTQHGCQTFETCQGMAGTCTARIAGDACTAANQCPASLSCNNWGASQICCPTACGTCQTCSGSTCQFACVNPNGCPNTGCTMPVSCNNLVKGWNGLICEKYTSNPSPMCGNGVAACVSAPTAPYCSSATTGTVSGTSSCGSTECIRPSSCQPLSAASTSDTTAKVCFNSRSLVEGSCPNNGVCDATGSCVKLNLGETCSVGGNCLSGNCVNGVCCSTASCPTCQACGAGTGTCASTCASAGGCAEPLCPAVQCLNRAKGFNANACEFYAGPANEGRCKMSGTCFGAMEESGCAWRTVTSVPATTCIDTSCRIVANCAYPADTSSFTPSSVCSESGNCSPNTGVCTTGGDCKLNAGETCAANGDCQSGFCRNNKCCTTDCDSNCGDCSTGTCIACTTTCNNAGCTAATIGCQDRIKGWVGTDCVKYTANKSGVKQCYQGQCANSGTYALCDTMTVTAITGGACTDMLCLIAGGCVVNNPVGGLLARSSVCDQSGVTVCDVGKVCRVTGSCAAPAAANGAACTIPSDCTSGFCSPQGVCCDTACTSPCGTCNQAGSVGTCKATCSTPGGCPNAMCTTVLTCSGITKGFNGGLCEKFNANTANGVCQTGVPSCASANDYQYCYGAVSTHFSCSSAGCNKACVAGLVATTAYPSLLSVCKIAGETCGGANICSATGYCGLPLGATTCAVNADCISQFCVATGASTKICCDSACSGQCDSCTGGTCTGCSTGAPTGCPTTYNSMLAGGQCTSTIACTNTVSGWNGNLCEKFTTNPPARCTSTNLCVSNDLAFCSGVTAVTGAPACADPTCKKACTVGQPAANFDNVNETCHTDGSFTCGANRRCGRNGGCLLVNGQPCNYGTDDALCVSQFCGGAMNPQSACCPTACSNGCFSCTSGSCQPTCASAAGCASVPATVCNGVSISCSGLTSGWVGNACHKYTANAAGRCTNGGGCTLSTDTAYCDSMTTVAFTCASSQCKKACVPRSPGPLALADVCHTSGQQMCGAGQSCDDLGACKNNYATACAVSSDCFNGAVCHRGKCCSAACGPCLTCDATGACVAPTCSNPNGCAPTNGDCSGTIGCTAVLAGWSGNDCLKYTTDPARLCRPTKLTTEPDLCTPSTLYSWCQTLAVPTTVASTCGMGCKDMSKCVQNALVGTGDANNKVCFTSGQNGCSTGFVCTFTGICNQPGGTCSNNGDCTGVAPFCEGYSTKFCCNSNMCSHACNNCLGGVCGFRCTNPAGCAEAFCAPTAINCNNVNKGWAGAVCERYTANSAGLCVNGGLCSTSTSYAYCSAASTAAATCADVQCVNPTTCQRGGVPPTMASQVCFTDGSVSCAPAFPGSVCGPLGKCLKVNGQTCAVGTECLSTICQQGVCCNEMCGAPVGMPGAGKLKECFKCNLAGSLGTCTNDNGNACGTATSVPCNTLLAGWAGTTCLKYSATTFGQCDATGACVTPNTLCQTNGVATAVKVTCGALSCVDATKCVRYAAEATATVATECKDSIAEPTCPAIACNSYVSGWNSAVCEQYSSSTVSGQCLSDASCAPATTAVSLAAFCPPAGMRTTAFACGSAACVIAASCTANTLASGWTVANSCQINVDQSACGDITCTNTVAGWNGAQCRRYSVAHLGRCGAGGLCETATSFCKVAAAQAAVDIPGALCPTPFCTDTTKCQENAVVTANDQISEICLISTAEPRCPDLSCVGLTSGISSSTCLRFTLDSTGHCDATSNCITQCTAVPLQATAAIATCASQECLRPGACPAGAAIGNWNTTAKLCYVADEDGLCAMGAKCDPTGLCRFLDTGVACSIDDNCKSKFCWKDPTMPMTNPGICCSAACKGDCEECATTRGTCLSRTGQVCGQPPRVATPVALDCPSYIRGWGVMPDSPLACYKYARTRTQECTAGAVCSAAASLCPAAAFSTGSTQYLTGCTSAACKQSCTPGDSIATVSQNDICITNQVVANCTDIGCKVLVSGWSGVTCNKWNLDHVGYCESIAAVSGRCSSDVALCATQAGQTEVAHTSCADVNCVIAAACQRNQPTSANPFATVCNADVVVNGCPDILCSSYIKGWNGATCERYQSNHPGYCTATAACDTSRSRCNVNTGIMAGLGAAPLFTCLNAACKKAGACVINADNPTALNQVCTVDALEAACPDIGCAATVQGWNGVACQRFSKDFSGWCLPDTSCDTDVKRCDNPEAVADGVNVVAISTAGVPIRCGSQACTIASACQKYSALSTSDAINEICSLSVDVAACGAPHTFPCAEFVTGWNGRNCERYNVNSLGHCNATATCINTCAQVPLQVKTTHRACGHQGCVIPSKCQAGEQSTLYASTASMCYTDMAQHGCDVGAKCNANGDCVFANDGQQCSFDAECGSKVCWKRPLNATYGICCNRACSNECEECATQAGSCLPRTDADCSFDVKCSTALKGFSVSAPNKCQRYRDDRKGVCLVSGTCGNAIQLCGAAAGVDLTLCKATQCAKFCPQYNNVSTAMMLAQVCHTNVNRQECTDIDCTQFVAGWSSADPTICQKYSSVHPGFCDSLAGCSQDATTCSDASVVSRALHVKCGDARCKKSCSPGSSVLAAAALADVCIVDTATSTCPVLGCSTRLKGWLGRTCQKYQIDRPGQCNTMAVCETNVAACSALPGTTHQRCGSDECAKSCTPGLDATLLQFSDVCAVNKAEPTCADIACTVVIKGWNGAVCERWSTDNTGYCDADSRCSESTQFCAGAGMAIMGADCGSLQCRRAGGCFPGAPLLFAASRAHVCDVNVDNSNCPSLACASKLAGWNSNVCTRYVRETSGYCDASATCLTQCKLVPAQYQVEVVRCASLGCVRADQCKADDALIAAGSVAAVCYTDRVQHGCQAGSVCNAAGACVFPDAGAKKRDNSLCANGAECTSGFCVLSDEKMNICCNSACSGPCVQCVSGVCQPKVGASCGDGICKTCDEAGACQLRTTLCAEKSSNGTGLFNCNTADKQCAAGQCLACAAAVVPPDISKAPNSTIVIKPMVDCIDAIDCGGGPTVAVPAGTCLQGKCVCNAGFTGKYCEGFTCDAKFNCNTRSSGGTCTGANKCTCNSGFTAPNCVATCAANATAGLAADCSGHGWCTAAPSTCVCDPGWTKADCSMPANLATPCANDTDCDTKACFKANANDTMGICCATACDRQCNTCAGIGANQAMRGFCQPLVGQQCGGAGKQCRACVLGTNGFATCGAFSSLCVDLGGANGTDYGCSMNQFCFDGSCENCAEPPPPDKPTVECGSGKFSVNFKYTNPKLPIRVCSGDQNDVLVSLSATTSTCALAWSPGKGVGVDCSGTVDGLLTGKDMEAVKITFSPPLSRRNNVTLLFDPFINMLDTGAIKITHVMSTTMARRRQSSNDTTTLAMTTETVLNITTATFALDDSFDQISALEITAFGAMTRFALLSMETTPLYVAPPATVASTTPPTTASTTPSTSSTTSEETTTTAMETEVDILQRIKNGFAGEDTPALGFTIGGIVLIVLCIVACIIVGVAMARRRAAQQKLFDAYGEGKPMQSFETVTAKPSTALGDDSDDEAPFGMLPTSSTTISAPAGGIKVEPLSSDEE